MFSSTCMVDPEVIYFANVICPNAVKEMKNLIFWKKIYKIVRVIMTNGGTRTTLNHAIDFGANLYISLIPLSVWFKISSSVRQRFEEFFKIFFSDSIFRISPEKFSIISRYSLQFSSVKAGLISLSCGKSFTLIQNKKLFFQFYFMLSISTLCCHTFHCSASSRFVCFSDSTWLSFWCFDLWIAAGGYCYLLWITHVRGFTALNDSKGWIELIGSKLLKLFAKNHFPKEGLRNFWKFPKHVLVKAKKTT